MLTEKLLEYEACDTASSNAFRAQQDSLESQLEALSTKYEERLCAADTRLMELENLCLAKDSQTRQLRETLRQLQSHFFEAQAEIVHFRRRVSELEVTKSTVSTSTPDVWEDIKFGETQTTPQHKAQSTKKGCVDVYITSTFSDRLRMWSRLNKDCTIIPTHTSPLQWTRLASTCQIPPTPSSPGPASSLSRSLSSRVRAPSAPRATIGNTNLTASLPPSQRYTPVISHENSPPRKRSFDTISKFNIPRRPVTASLCSAETDSFIYDLKATKPKRHNGLSRLKQTLQSQESQLIGSRRSGLLDAYEITRRYNSPPRFFHGLDR
eukprot:Blabericola_migrator_1__3371@NODE_1998_length_3443_cov_125_220083_g1271_i0_p2_GENE_NODE_1998_length_3443_cov_125_220083_g1271_i0NODE_1998_length_3443_cov_125_220083_g1271_i0_p2_ORF_typecomplete_len323_score41_07K1377/PF15352_6/2_4e02K1377/PF15352_6/0_16Uso1_p115_C/PF04871_13/0_064Uso1_p115_C/PF04871_13/6_5e02TMF_DNA_bd/PF12329_8/1_9e02TMF_DNA_bd/PF12329_8/4_7TMF_DNA_bd/PF12329_8/3_8e02Brr6_like_C_C/PF10104_9/0_23NAAAbeta/PF15508_6/3_3e03NAAAbeta/PF15508_6/0_86DUF3584/PF12128_8/0_21DUF3584/PF1212